MVWYWESRQNTRPRFLVLQYIARNTSQSPTHAGSSIEAPGHAVGVYMFVFSKRALRGIYCGRQTFFTLQLCPGPGRLSGTGRADAGGGGSAYQEAHAQSLRRMADD